MSQCFRPTLHHAAPGSFPFSNFAAIGLCAISCGSSRFSSLAWTGISCPGLACDVQPSDHSQVVVGSYVGILSNVPTSDACSTNASSHFDSASSFSTHSSHASSTKLPSIVSTSTKYSGISAVSTFTKPFNSTLSTHSSSPHQPFTHFHRLSNRLGFGFPTNTPHASTNARIFGFDLNEH